MKAELCPVCRGSGVYPARIKNENFFGNPQPSIVNPPNAPKQGEIQERKCHGCFGRGFVVMPSGDDHGDYFPPHHYPKHKPHDSPFGPFGPPYRIGDPPRRRWGDNMWCKGYSIQSTVRYRY